MTIKEIAKLAGVSSAAVSRYLNGGYVSDEKKEQIKKVIDETGYQPSAQARMLRTKKACLIGVVVPKINSESISRITAGIEKVLSERNYQMLLAGTDNTGEGNRVYASVRELSGRRDYSCGNDDHGGTPEISERIESTGGCDWSAYEICELYLS